MSMWTTVSQNKSITSEDDFLDGNPKGRINSGSWLSGGIRAEDVLI